MHDVGRSMVEYRTRPIPQFKSLDMKPLLRPLLNFGALVGGSVLANLAFAQTTYRVEPFDEANQDPSFLAFRTDLIDAVVRRDTDFVIEQAAEDIFLSFGNVAGRAEFRNMLTSGDDAYWKELEEVLRLGGAFTSTTVFEAPYTWTANLPGELDPFFAGFIIGEDVVLRDRPARSGGALALLDYEVVTVVGGGQCEYETVRTAAGIEGYVHRDYLRSPIDYRAIFEFRDGRWLITLFIAGD